MIREFYGSLSRGADGWTATVRGVTFVLTAEVLSQILQIPSSGAVLDVLADRDDGIRCILERDDIRGVTTVIAVQLSVEMRLLQHVVARIFLSKTGRFDYITERELLIMTTLVRGQTVSFSGIILRQMHEAASSRRLCLPYGMVLTRIFRYFGVTLDGELYRELHHSDTYDDRSLHRMGYRFIRGRWTRRVSGQDAETDSEDEAHATEAGPSGTAGADDADDRSTTPPADTAPPTCPTASTTDPTIQDRVASELEMLRQELRATQAIVSELSSRLDSRLSEL